MRALFCAGIRLAKSPCLENIPPLRSFASASGNALSFPQTLKTRVAKADQKPAILSSRDGPTFSGQSFGAYKDVSGEAVFTTSLVGYPESMTDPSYRGQILVFTTPLIGNYGVPSADIREVFNLLKHFESEYIQPSGIVVADVALQYSHWTAVQSLAE